MIGSGINDMLVVRMPVRPPLHPRLIVCQGAFTCSIGIDDIKLQLVFGLAIASENHALAIGREERPAVVAARCFGQLAHTGTISIHDEDKWFDNVFQCGPGFQVAQLFVEHVFDNYIDWTRITKQSENYKRPLQELLQSEFKTTPHLMEIVPYSNDSGYTMGVYLVLGEPTHGKTHKGALPKTTFHTFEGIHIHMAQNSCIYLFLGEGTHKIKQTAEQSACKNAIELLKQFHDFGSVIGKVQQKHAAFT